MTTRRTSRTKRPSQDDTPARDVASNGRALGARRQGGGGSAEEGWGATADAGGARPARVPVVAHRPRPSRSPRHHGPARSAPGNRGPGGAKGEEGGGSSARSHGGRGERWAARCAVFRAFGGSGAWRARPPRPLGARPASARRVMAGCIRDDDRDRRPPGVFPSRKARQHSTAQRSTGAGPRRAGRRHVLGWHTARA